MIQNEVNSHPSYKQMTHRDVERLDILDRYVADQLSPEEGCGFEEHLFSCDECFEQVQSSERFAAGVRYMAVEGLLKGGDAKPARVESPSFAWLKGAFLVAATAALMLAIAVGWLVFYQAPRSRAELARDRQTREQTERETRQKLDQTLDELQHEQQQRSELETQLALLKAGESAPQDEVEANVPVVMLQAARATDGATSELSIPRGARSLVLLAEVEAGTRFASFRLDVHTAEGQRVDTIKGLNRNGDGTVGVKFPARPFQTGKYLVKLYGVSGQRDTLVGEYRLQIRKR